MYLIFALSCFNWDEYVQETYINVKNVNDHTSNLREKMNMNGFFSLLNMMLISRNRCICNTAES